MARQLKDLAAELDPRNMPLLQGGNNSLFQGVSSKDVGGANQSATTSALASGAKSATERALQGNVDSHKSQIEAIQRTQKAKDTLSNIEMLYDKFSNLPMSVLASPEGKALADQYIPGMDNEMYANTFLPKVAQRKNIINQLNNMAIGQPVSPKDRQSMMELGISNPERYMQLKPKSNGIMDAVGGAIGGAAGAIGGAVGSALGAIGDTAGAIGNAAGPALGAIGNAAGPAFLTAVKGQAQSSSGIGNPLSPLKAGYDQIDELQRLKTTAESRQPPLRKVVLTVNDNNEPDPNGDNKAEFTVDTLGNKSFIGTTGLSDKGKEKDRINRLYQRTDQAKEIAVYRNNLARSLDIYKNKNSINTAEAKNLNSQAIKLEKQALSLESSQTELNTFQTKIVDLTGLINTLESQGKLGAVNGRITNAINTLDPSDPLVAKFQSIQSSLTIDVAKKLQKLGVLSKSDFEIVGRMIPQLKGAANYNKEILSTLSKNISQRTDENNQDIQQSRALIESWRAYGGSQVKGNLGPNATVGDAIKGARPSGGQIDPSRLSPQDLGYYNYAKAHPEHPDSKAVLNNLRKGQGL